MLYLSQLVSDLAGEITVVARIVWIPSAQFFPMRAPGDSVGLVVGSAVSVLVFHLVRELLLTRLCEGPFEAIPRAF